MSLLEISHHFAILQTGNFPREIIELFRKTSERLKGKPNSATEMLQETLPNFASGILEIGGRPKLCPDSAINCHRKPSEIGFRNTVELSQNMSKQLSGDPNSLSKNTSPVSIHTVLGNRPMLPQNDSPCLRTHQHRLRKLLVDSP